MSLYKEVQAVLSDKGFYARVTHCLSKNWDISPEAKALFMYFTYKQKIASTRDLVKQTGLADKTINLRKRELAIYGFLKPIGKVKKRNRFEFNPDASMWGIHNEALEYEILQNLEYGIPQNRSTAYSKLEVPDTPNDPSPPYSKDSLIKKINKEDEKSNADRPGPLDGPPPPYESLEEFLARELPLGPTGVIREGGVNHGRKKVVEVNKFVFSLSG